MDGNFRHFPLLVCAILGLGVLAAQSGTRKPEPTFSVRVLFGLTDTGPSRWDGSVQLDEGHVTAIQGLRFGAEDSTDYQSSWRAVTRQQGNYVLENGVI